MTSSSSLGALEAVERILNRGGERDEVLRQVVNALHARAATWVGIAFIEHAGLELGPRAGGAKPVDHQRHPIEWQGQTIAELWTSAEADPALCARIAVIVSPYCRAARDGT
jgi:hypothetical protein